MKKFLLATLATTAVATAAQAGSISYDFRGDYQSADYNNAAETAGSTKNADFSRFYFKVGRIDFKGNLNEDTSYRVRWAFYGASPTYTTRDNLNTQIQLAYVTQKLGSGFSLSVGKLASDIGGFEGMSSGAELYLTSEAYSHKFGNDTLGSRTYGTGDSTILYMTGAKLEYTFADQVIEAMVLNPPQDETVGGKFQQNVNFYGIAWKGSFVDKALSTIVSYHEGSATNSLGSNLPTGTASPANYTSDDKTKFYTAGIKWDSNPVMVSAEYNGQQADYKTSGSFSDKMNSYVVKAAYTGWDQWTPRLELTSTEEKIDGATTATNRFFGYGAIVEYKPRKEDIFRYHVAYQNIKENPETGDDRIRQEFVVGARLMGDFLK